MKKFNLLALVLSSVLVAGVSTAVLAGDRHGGHGSHLLADGKMFKGLDLTDAQKTQVDALLKAHREQMLNKAERYAMHEELQSVLISDTFDEAGVRVILEKQQAKKLEQEVAQLKLQHQIRALLTPEQKAKLDERKAKMRQRMQEKMAEHQGKAGTE
ncbi:Spy/CpxP family protein refolding chaperone [Rheinheimera sp.]|uniref:Spy/CpxP family protein refolding chaperone n=1 Tax=Rheinheimera sp. TaxID=1869214 RepID=UPI0025D52444|nr:Spy/CpxP family protein refolding chaperone [Rheinheimera sp.]